MNLIEIKNETAFADSLQVAKYFRKRHSDVMTSIEKLLQSESSLNRKVRSVNYKDASGKTNKMYLLDRDMFSLVVMGFTGKKALTWKLKYIEAFNKMESIILEKQSTDWQLTRKNGKLTRRNETDRIAQFILYAEQQGSNSANKYYIHFSNLVNKALNIKKGKRDNLTPAMLAHVATFEDQVSSLLAREMITDKYYKTIYQNIKQRISILSEMMILPNCKYLPSSKHELIEQVA